MNGAHWAADLIGRPYELGAQGPMAFDCWGLVRWVFSTVHNIDMPIIDIGESTNARAIKLAAEASGWRPSGAREPAENDIVLMNRLQGRHVGTMVRANGDALLLLHCLERIGVCAQPLDDIRRIGFHGFVFWRRA